MISAIVSLTILGAVLGLGLGIAARKFAVETDPLIGELEALMPGSNCGQCGLPGCSGAARAIAAREIPPTICPPGGKALAAALAAKLGISLDLTAVKDEGPKVALVAEEICIGCCKCVKVCPTDAIVGAAKQMHTVVASQCTGCELCLPPCPVDCIAMVPIGESVATWKWKYPTFAVRRAA